MRFNSTVNEEPYQGLKFVTDRRWKHWPSHKDSSTGAAWLSSARVLRCSLKWGNERNPYSRVTSVTRNCPARSAEDCAISISRFQCSINFQLRIVEIAKLRLNIAAHVRELRAGRKEGMTSNQHGPLMPWATLMLQWPGQWVANPQGGANPIKHRPQFGLRAATCPHEAGIASNRKSATLR